MTAAQKRIQAYIDSIPADEDRKGMMGYRFLSTPSNRARRQRQGEAKPIRKNSRKKTAQHH